MIKYLIIKRKEIMNKYGSDKPDYSLGMAFIDVLEWAKKEDFIKDLRLPLLG